MLLQVPMIKPEKLLKIFKFIKFLLTQSTTDLIDCEHLGPTFLWKGRDVLRTDLDKTCQGSYYLENKTAILEKCGFDFKAAEEQVLQISPNNWLVSSPIEYSAHIICDINTMSCPIIFDSKPIYEKTNYYQHPLKLLNCLQKPLTCG